MEFKSGQWCRTRGGGKAYVAAVADLSGYDGEHNGETLMAIHEGEHIAHHYSDGRYLAAIDGDIDLVSLITDPQTPEPPEGYEIVELAEGEVARKGDRYSNGRNWYEIVIDDFARSHELTFARKIKPAPATDWIPTPGNGPDARLPTKVDGKRFWITISSPDGKLATSTAGIGWLLSNWKRLRVVAWTVENLPVPYVRPEPEKRERDEIIVYDDGIYDSIQDARLNGGLINPDDACRYIKKLPGDPDPDAVREVAKELRGRLDSRSVALADKLEGK